MQGSELQIFWETEFWIWRLSHLLDCMRLGGFRDWIGWDMSTSKQEFCAELFVPLVPLSFQSQMALTIAGALTFFIAFDPQPVFFTFTIHGLHLLFFETGSESPGSLAIYSPAKWNCNLEWIVKGDCEEILYLANMRACVRNVMIEVLNWTFLFSFKTKEL